MKICDCFMFYNELEILDIRLHEVYDVVDYIIIIEATKTHTGKTKPLYYAENKERYSKYSDKIVYMLTDFEEKHPFTRYLNAPSADWYREHYQRECIQVALNNLNLANEDVIIVTDVDEIPNKVVMQNIKDNRLKIENNCTYSFEMALYYYNIELTTNRKWYHSVMFNHFTYKQIHLLTPVRLAKKTFTISNSGWHLSYFGDENFIKNKVESFAESTSYTSDGKDINYLKDCIEKSILHFNKEQLIHTPLQQNANVPSYFKV